MRLRISPVSLLPLLHLGLLGTHITLTNSVAEVGGFHQVQAALLWVSCESRVPQGPKGSSQLLHVQLHGVAVDNYVIKVHNGVGLMD